MKVQKEVYTLVVFPGSTGSPKRIQIAKSMVKFAFYSFLIISVGVVGSTIYFSKQLIELRRNKAELVDLRRTTKVQKNQIQKFSQQVRSFENEMARLERFEKKLKIITALDSSAKPPEVKWGVGGPYGLTSHSFTTSMDKEAQSMVDGLSDDLSLLTKHAKVQLISLHELDNFFKNQKSLLSATPSIWPTRGWVTSTFGYRKSPFTGLREKHEGLDIAARSGSKIRAPADGIVIVQGRENGYGNMLQIDHGYGLVTVFGHNSKHLVNVGDKIKRGQVIALIGNTGRSTGPHLHYEILLNGVSVDPRNYILDE